VVSTHLEEQRPESDEHQHGIRIHSVGARACQGASEQSSVDTGGCRWTTRSAARRPEPRASRCGAQSTESPVEATLPHEPVARRSVCWLAR
jgi:hypothetical protein